MIFNLIIALALVASIRAKVRDESQHGLKVPNMNVVPEGLSWKEIEDANHKVVGGTPTTAGRYPWFVWANGCGGQLIGKDIVLTAAHCNSVWTGTVYVNIFKGNQNGINQCGKAGTAGADCEKFQVSSRKMHPNYDSNKYDYDYLLVKLNGESKQEPILIVEADDNIVDDVLATTLGFGTTKVGGGGSTSVTQLEATVDFKTANTCGNNYDYSPSDITSRMNCGYTEGKDACQGDSGGPFIKKGSASDGSLDIVLGVVSWGIGCGNVNAPGVYADVLDQRDWIVGEACKMTDVGGTCTIGDRGPAVPTISSQPITTPVPAPVPAPISTDAPSSSSNDDEGDDYYDDYYYGGVDCSNVDNFKTNKKYKKGQEVVYNYELFESRVNNNKRKNPYKFPKKWESMGYCEMDVSPCDGISDWNKNRKYKKNEEVVFKDTLYKARRTVKKKNPNNTKFWTLEDFC